MARATIKSNLGDGLYRVRIEYDASKLDTLLANLQGRVDLCNRRIDELSDQIREKQRGTESLKEEQRIAILEMNRSEPDQVAEAAAVLDAITVELMAINDDVGALERQRGFFELNREAARDRARLLTALRDDRRDADVWSADYNDEYETGLAVGLKWPNADPDSDPVITPGGVDADPAYKANEHGVLKKEATNTPAGSFFNRAVMPLVQKSLKTWRTGTASNVNDTSMTVTLDPASSRYGGVDININGVLPDVPVKYLDCDGAAFENGDDVLVEFAGNDQTKPTVIGFVHDPRPCDECEDPMFIAGHRVPSEYVSTISVLPVDAVRRYMEEIRFPARVENTYNPATADSNGFSEGQERNHQILRVKRIIGTAAYSAPGVDEGESDVTRPWYSVTFEVSYERYVGHDGTGTVDGWRTVTEDYGYWAHLHSGDLGCKNGRLPR